MQTKKQAILEALRRGSLNRFEAERLGDHCLNTTISELRKDGHSILSHPEKVDTRFGRKTRCKRYYLAGGA